jgi:hypothetical protein
MTYTFIIYNIENTNIIKSLKITPYKTPYYVTFDNNNKIYVKDKPNIIKVYHIVDNMADINYINVTVDENTQYIKLSENKSHEYFGKYEKQYYYTNIHNILATLDISHNIVLSANFIYSFINNIIFIININTGCIIKIIDCLILGSLLYNTTIDGLPLIKVSYDNKYLFVSTCFLLVKVEILTGDYNIIFTPITQYVLSINNKYIAILSDYNELIKIYNFNGVFLHNIKSKTNIDIFSYSNDDKVFIIGNKKGEVLYYKTPYHFNYEIIFQLLLEFNKVYNYAELNRITHDLPEFTILKFATNSIFDRNVLKIIFAYL